MAPAWLDEPRSHERCTLVQQRPLRAPLILCRLVEDCPLIESRACHLPRPSIPGLFLLDCQLWESARPRHLHPPHLVTLVYYGLGEDCPSRVASASHIPWPSFPGLFLHDCQPWVPTPSRHLPSPSPSSMPKNRSLGPPKSFARCSSLPKFVHAQTTRAKSFFFRFAAVPMLLVDMLGKSNVPSGCLGMPDPYI